MASSGYDYIIVGAGCWGASTALALKRSQPGLRILMFDGTHTRTASRDINKIVHSTYPVSEYAELAEEAQRLWREDPYRQFYHECGWIRVLNESSPVDLRGKNDKVISLEGMQKMVGSEEKLQLDPGEQICHNPDVGYVDSDQALEAILTTARVQIVQDNVTKLIIEDDVCVGVEVGDDIYRAKKTIVAAGPWINSLLRSSGVPFRDNFFTIYGVPVATMRLTDKEFEALKSMPILATENGETNPLKLAISANVLLGEVIMSERHQVLKITSRATFKFEDLCDSEYQERLKSLDISPNRRVLDKVLPQFTGRDLDGWICLDLLTPGRYPLIAEAESTPHLYLIGGGSFQGFKFLPNIGDIMAGVVLRTIKPDSLQERFVQGIGWDRGGEKVPLHSGAVPKVIKKAT